MYGFTLGLKMNDEFAASGQAREVTVNGRAFTDASQKI